MIGQRFGKLLVIDYAGKRNGHQMWLCKCDCGAEVIKRGSNLTSGHTKSCGCNSAPYLHRKRIAGTCIDSLESKAVPKDNTSGYRGVCWDKRSRKWVARISLQGKSHYLGSFSNIQDAVKARKRGEEMYKEFLKNYYHELNQKEQTGLG